jgi:hypothetical protein
VHIVKRPVNCTAALRLMAAYYAAPAGELQGNAAFWSSQDGWECFSPTAGSAEEQGFSSACDRKSTGARIEVR